MCKNKMKIYWFIKNISEFEGMNKLEINKIWFPCYIKTFRHWQQWLATLIIISFLFNVNLFKSIPLIPVVVFGGFLGIVWSQISIYLARPYIRKMLNESKNT